MEEEKEAVDSGYETPLPDEIRWRNWAADDEGITGDKLLDFVNDRVFDGIKGLDARDNRRAQIIKQVFEDTYNYMKNGVLMRQVINEINKIDFTTDEDRHLFNDIYEMILKELQSAGSSGEFYTPRAVTRFIVDMVDPKLNEKVLDPACGTGGFLVSSFENMCKDAKNVRDLKRAKNNLMGIEKKPLPHLLCMTNLILHDVEEPNIRHDNSLASPLRDYSAKDMVDCVVTNPPFGGAEEDGIENNFPSEFQTRETADLFLVLIMKLLKGGGRCGIVLPDGFLFGEGVKTRIKERLLSDFNLHTIVKLPKDVFSPYTNIGTNLLFFEKGKPTKEIWYFEHPLPEGYKAYNKGKPIQISEFDLEKGWWSKRTENKYAWKVGIDEIRKGNYNLDVRNPNIKEEEKQHTPKELIRMLNKSIERSKNTLGLIMKEIG